MIIFKIQKLNYLLHIFLWKTCLFKYPAHTEFPGYEKSEEKYYLLLGNQIPWDLILYPIYGCASYSKLKWTFHPCVS